MGVALHRGLTAALALATATLCGCGGGEWEKSSPFPSHSPSPRRHVRPGDELVSERGAFEDALLELRLRQALLEGMGTAALDVDPRVEPGEVRLRGRVSSPVHGRLAREIAEATPGVAAVRVDLAIGGAVGKPPGEGERRLRDALLATGVRAALVRELGGSAFALGIEASGSRVTLSGVLAGREVRERALAAAAAVDGVEEVRSFLIERAG